MKKLVLLLIIFLSNYAYANCDPNKIEVKKDDFAGKVSISSDLCKNSSDVVDYGSYRLMSAGKDNFAILLIASYSASAWRYYTSALDSNKKEYNLPVRRTVSNCRASSATVWCSYLEIMIIPLTRNDLESFAKNGIQIRLNTAIESINKMNYITPEFAKVFLNKHDEVFSAK